MHVVLIGPQRFRPTLRETLETLGVTGPVAAVTAGWQERESEDREMEEHVGREVVDLLLYHRYEDVLQRDTELRDALQERQERLREQQDLYRLRLDSALESARELMRRPGKGGALDDHRRGAIRVLRTMDRQHVRRVRKIHEEFERTWQPATRETVVRHRDQILKLIERTGVLAVAGGHVATLLNRLRLFDVGALLGRRPIVAWSAGAMALAERVVLFHDSPPQGPGNPEVLDVGLAYFRGPLPLPHASQRLRLEDPVRVALFARRFSPAVCVAFDPGARVDIRNGDWRAAAGTRYLTRRGRIRTSRGL